MGTINEIRERLTYDSLVADNHCWQIKGADNNLCEEVCKNRCDNQGCEGCPIAEAFNRLAEYENTGMMPEDIKSLLDEVERLTGENELLKDMYTAAVQYLCIPYESHRRNLAIIINKYEGVENA